MSTVRDGIKYFGIELIKKVLWLSDESLGLFYYNKYTFSTNNYIVVMIKFSIFSTNNTVPDINNVTNEQ